MKKITNFFLIFDNDDVKFSGSKDYEEESNNSKESEGKSSSSERSKESNEENKINDSNTKGDGTKMHNNDDSEMSNYDNNNKIDNGEDLQTFSKQMHGVNDENDSFQSKQMLQRQR